ncbi:DUF1697 domain-containing protein [uncultured Bdellovibrio sp.]|uniref:DUF1697 domain-containing protein n=1 Tax=Bdellovibrio sp. HCB-162 TaxID=3394234 RepID=UPI0025DD6613|nr:DUF1697 domain-containing protein [uncultured Bdellovibrio sp.]
MPRYIAFLRGVSPLNAKMPEVKLCFEKMGFTNVVTVLSSGNVVFDAKKTSQKILEKQIEDGLAKYSKRSFPTIVRAQEDLRDWLDSDPFREEKSNSKAKRVVTFLKENPTVKPNLPIKKDGAAILKIEGTMVCSTYLPHPKGPAFMVLLEKTFGKSITTRTLDTLKKVIQK